jgi:ABC-type uncharacterized transport system involved in gliding motility auxiliary subunit
MKHPKKVEALLYSAVGVFFMFIVILGVNLLFGATRLRMDLTEDKLYTLTEGTKKILKKVDSPVEIRFYCSRGESRMPSTLRNFAQNIEDLLAEFKAQNPANIQIKKFDPKPDTEAEDLARLDGIEGQPLPSGESFYMGVCVSLDPQKVSVPFLSPERERLLEYDLARAVARVLSTNKPVIGLMTPLPIAGMPMNPMMMQMGRRGQEPWIILGELKADFDVQTVPMETEKIDDNIKVLMVVHPKSISDKAQFAIDQFVLRGGKLIAFLDPACLLDQSGQNPMGLNMGGGSSLPKLLKAWGLEFDTAKVAIDLSFIKEIGGQDGRPQKKIEWLFVNPEGINTKDAIMSQFDDILMPCAGVFTGTPATGLKMDVLLHTTTNSETIESFMAQMGGGGQKTLDEFKRSGKEMALAVRLSGKFKTAFPDGKPAEDKKDEEKTPDGEKKDVKPDEKKEPAKDDSLKESKADNVVYLVGDADLMYDGFSVRKHPIFGFAQPLNGNLTFVQSMVEQMAGDSDLIGVRSRASIRHPFTVVEKMHVQAQEKFQDRISKLEKEAQDAQTKLSELRVKKDGNQRFIVPPEARAEIEKLEKINAQASKELRRARKDLKQEEASLENGLKWMNIGAMPVAVTLAGLLLAAVRRKRTVAR